MEAVDPEWRTWRVGRRRVVQVREGSATRHDKLTGGPGPVRRPGQEW